MNSLKAEIESHLISLFFFTFIFLVAIFISYNTVKENPYADIDKLLKKSGLSLQNELDRAVIKDVLKNYFGNEKAKNLTEKIEKYRSEILTNGNFKSVGNKLNLTSFKSILSKWINFLFLFGISAFLLFYFSESFALVKLKLLKLGKSNFALLLLKEINAVKDNPSGYKKTHLNEVLKLIFFILVKIFAYLILFSPVYIVAYVFKFNYENISTLAYLILTLFTNGMLILSVNKFFLLLQGELNKGYVLTDKIKGVKTGFTKDDGISFARIFSFHKNFGIHILKSVYLNAHRQFIYDFKEISRFLITGIVIVELSLNIQNGFFYEMLQHLMRNEVDILLTIILLVFISVKVSDILITYFFYRENLKYENRNAKNYNA